MFCHGASALIDTRLSDGSYLVDGRTVTGFADVEEDFSDAAAGQTVMPYRVEDELRRRGANYTGQQQYSGEKVAALVIEALGD